MKVVPFPPPSNPAWLLSSFCISIGSSSNICLCPLLPSLFRLLSSKSSSSITDHFFRALIPPPRILCLPAKPSLPSSSATSKALPRLLLLPRRLFLLPLLSWLPFLQLSKGKALRTSSLPVMPLWGSGPTPGWAASWRGAPQKQAKSSPFSWKVSLFPLSSSIASSITPPLLPSRQQPLPKYSLGASSVSGVFIYFIDEFTHFFFFEIYSFTYSIYCMYFIFCV